MIAILAFYLLAAVGWVAYRLFGFRIFRSKKSEPECIVGRALNDAAPGEMVDVALDKNVEVIVDKNGTPLSIGVNGEWYPVVAQEDRERIQNVLNQLDEMNGDE